MGKEMGPDDPDFPSRLTVFLCALLYIPGPFSKVLSLTVVSTTAQLEAGNAGS